MEVVKETADYKILKKRNGRYGVRGKDGKWINGDKKIEILNGEGLIKVTLKPKPAPEETAEAAAPEEEAAENTEEAAAEAPAEEPAKEE